MTNTTTHAITALLDGVTPERLWVSENGKFLVYPEHPVFPTDVPYVRADLYAAALARAEAAEAALPRAWEAGRDAAATAADYAGAIQDQRDGSYAGSVAVMGRDVGDIIRALTPPAALAAMEGRKP